MKKIILLIIALGLMTTAVACSDKTLGVNLSKSSEQTNSKLQIEVSFNAMREFAEAVGGNKVEVKTIVPDGTEPHDFEPKAGDIIGLGKAKIFAYNGLGMESWVKSTLESIDNKALISVDTSYGIPPISAGRVLGEGQYDPHIWLSIKDAQLQSKNIEEALIKADPQNKSYYEGNYKRFHDKLQNLYEEYLNKFKNIKNRNFVTGHAAFAYLCRDFGLKQNSVEDVFAEGEPSAKKLKDLIDYCRANKIDTIFVEDMVSPRVSETLANAVGAKVEKINTLESKNADMDYLQSMRNNLQKIYDSLR